MDCELSTIDHIIITSCSLQPVLDKLKEIATGVDDDEGEEGGIQMDKAFKRMREQDKVDKQIYREKIKQKHRVSKKYVYYIFEPHDLRMPKMWLSLMIYTSNQYSCDV